MGILLWLAMGLLAGILAKWMMPGSDPGGIVVTTLIGIGGACDRRWNDRHGSWIRNRDQFQRPQLAVRLPNLGAQAGAVIAQPLKRWTRRSG